jgi:hypothetical protein
MIILRKLKRVMESMRCVFESNIQVFIWRNWEQPRIILKMKLDSPPDFEPTTFRMWIKYRQEELILKTIKGIVWLCKKVVQTILCILVYMWIWQYTEGLEIIPLSLFGPDLFLRTIGNKSQRSLGIFPLQPFASPSFCAINILDGRHLTPTETSSSTPCPYVSIRYRTSLSDIWRSSQYPRKYSWGDFSLPDK